MNKDYSLLYTFLMNWEFYFMAMVYAIKYFKKEAGGFLG